MKGKFKALFSRIPWRMIVAVLGIGLVINGGARMLSVELPAESEGVTQMIEQGMVMVVVGGVVLIAVVLGR
jgi:hypothetical protein